MYLLVPLRLQALLANCGVHIALIGGANLFRIHSFFLAHCVPYSNSFWIVTT